MTLYIDTSSNKSIKIYLKNDDKIVDIIESDIKLVRAEAAIPLIDKLFKKNGLELENLSNIEVVEGPGSFTGLRVGVSIANALAFLLDIPVNNRKIGELALPVYN